MMMKTGRAVTILLSSELNTSESDFLVKSQDPRSTIHNALNCVLENVNDATATIAMELLKKKRYVFLFRFFITT